MNTFVTVVRSFKYAFAGIAHFVVSDRNGRVEIGCAVAAIILGFILKINVTEWIALVLCIGAVLAFEMMNHAIEKLCDLVHKEYHPTIKIVKDVAAGATLAVCIASVAVGSIIFLPKIYLFL